MAIQIQIRRDTAANWTSVDPILAEGEFGLETDTNQLKIGDGVLAWTALAYFGGGGNPFDQDLNTTDAVVFAGLTNNAIIYPTSDGTAGQAIVTDGAGNLSFASGANPFDQDLNTTDPVVFAGLTNNAIVYPTSDGTAGQAIVTDGAGNLSFATAGNPFDQDLNTTDPVIFNKVTLTGPIVERQVAASFTSGTLTLDCNSANVFTHALTANVTTVTINNIPTSGSAIGLTLILEADGTQRTITWPASFLWSGNSPPTITATNASKDAIVFFTYDAGTSWLSFVAGQDLYSVVVASGQAIFGYGIAVTTYFSMTNLVSNTGVVATDTTGVGTARQGLAAASFGTDKAIFGYGESPGQVSLTNLVSNTGVVSGDVTGVGTDRTALASSGYGGDKAIFGYGDVVNTSSSLTNLVSNVGVVSTDTAGVGTARVSLAAASYGTDKAIFGYGASGAYPGTVTNITNLVSNTGVVSNDVTGVGTSRNGPAAAGYGGDKVIFGYGTTSYPFMSYYSMTNLVSNTGVVASDVTGVGTVRAFLAAAKYGTDKAIFGYGYTGAAVSMTNLVSNTGVVSGDVTGVGTARYGLAAASYG